MATIVQLNLDRSLDTIDVVSNTEASKIVADSRDVAALKNKLEKLCGSLQEACGQFDAYGKHLFASHRRQIVHLAVQIASRYLAREIARGEYEIEKILVQAIEQVPSGQAVEIRMNPDDLKVYEEQIKNSGSGPAIDIKLTPDWSIGPAQCIVDTPQGMMEYLIEEYLKQTEIALQASQ